MTERKIVMMENMMELYPIGTVIRLRGATKKVMIFGVCQTEKEKGEEYDYIGVIWPEGNIGNEGQILFNHKDIEEVLFTGYSNEERMTFLARLKKFYETKR